MHRKKSVAYRATAVSVVVASGVLWPIALHAESRSSVYDVSTRAGVTVRVLLIKPEQPVATLLLFTGGPGRASIGPKGEMTTVGFPALSFTGGGPPLGDACESAHYHSYQGLDEEVVSRMAEWIKSNLKH